MRLLDNLSCQSSGIRNAGAQTLDETLFEILSGSQSITANVGPAKQVDERRDNPGPRKFNPRGKEGIFPELVQVIHLASIQEGDNAVDLLTFVGL